MTTLFLFDIEGTTTDFNFVHKVLFPYSRRRLREFVSSHGQELKASLTEVQKTIAEEKLTASVADTLISWIDQDRKHKALKDIQGLIWDEGYRNGDFQGHVYEDVRPFFEGIKRSGKKIGIYSSGSVKAQKLILGYSTAGDLTPLVDFYFDTSVGHKREAQSYRNIAAETTLPPSEIHFFSDVPEELQAAQEAGLIVTHVLRDGTKPSAYAGVGSFSEVSL